MFNLMEKRDGRHHYKACGYSTAMKHQGGVCRNENSYSLTVKNQDVAEAESLVARPWTCENSDHEI